MKALFWVDNIPFMEMFAPIIDALSDEWEVAFANYGRTKQDREKVNDYAHKLGVRCGLLQKRNWVSILDMICAESPDIMVLAREEATPVEKIIAQIGKATGVPTLLVPHGILMPNEVEKWGVEGRLFRLRHIARLVRQGYRKLKKDKTSLFYVLKAGVYRVGNDFRDKKTLSRYDNFTKIAAFGEAMKVILIRYDVPPENIVITGNTKFDEIYRAEQGTDTRVILLITNYLVEFGTWTERQREKYILDVSGVANELARYLWVKIHPVSERMKEYEDIRHKNFPSFRFAICQEQPLVKMIANCDIAITTMSAGGLEVMASGKPLVIYNPYNDVTQYPETSGVYTTRNKDELLSVVKDIIDNGVSEERKKMASEFVYQQAYLQDGKASERIANLIEEMV